MGPISTSKCSVTKILATIYATRINVAEVFESGSSLTAWIRIGGFELNGSFGIYVTMTDIPIIFECQVADS